MLYAIGVNIIAGRLGVTAIKPISKNTTNTWYKEALQLKERCNVDYVCITAWHSEFEYYTIFDLAEYCMNWTNSRQIYNCKDLQNDG